MALTSEQAKAILKPLHAAFNDNLEKGNVEVAGDFYAPEAILIHKGKNHAFGRDDIKKFLAPFAVPTDTILTNEVYEATSDHIVYKATFKTVIKSSGTEFNGKFEQNFRKDGDKWLIIYDEFET